MADEKISLSQLLNGGTGKLKEAGTAAKELTRAIKGSETATKGLAKALGDAQVMAKGLAETMAQAATAAKTELGHAESSAKGLNKTLSQSKTTAKGLGKAMREAGGAGKGLEESGKHAKGFAGSMAKAGKMTKEATETIKSFKKLGSAAFDFVKDGVKEFEKLNTGEAKAEAGLRSTGATAGQASQALQGPVKAMKDIHDKAGTLTSPMATFKAQVDGLRKSVVQLGDDSKNRLATAMSGVVTEFQSGVNWVGKHKDLIDSATLSWEIYTKGTKLAKAAVDGYKKATQLVKTFEKARAEGLTILQGAQWALNLAMDANPVGLLVIGLAALGGLLYYLWTKTHNLSLILGILFGPVGVAVGYAIQHFDKLKAYLTGFWTMIKELGSNIGKLFTGVWDIVTHPLHPGKGIDEIKSVVSGAYHAAKDAKDESLAQSEKKAKSAAEATGAGDKPGEGTDTADAPEVDFGAEGNRGKDVNDKRATGTHAGAMPTVPATNTPPTGNTKDTSPKASSGNRSVTINIHINKLIEKFEIHANQMSESYGKIEEHVTNVLLSATNNASINANI